MALALLRQYGIRFPKTEQVHLKLMYCLRNCGEPVAENSGRQLDLLRGFRKVADYELDASQFVDDRKARSEVERAQRIIDGLDHCKTSPDFRSKLRAQAKLLGLPVSD